MQKVDTNELEKLLQGTHPEEFKEFTQQYKESLALDERQFMLYFNERVKEKGLKKQDILLKADIPQGYGYKLLTQEKTTKRRDIILRICYAAEFTLEETQRALMLYHMGKLYARDQRDAMLMICFNERPGGIIEVNELLMKHKLEPLRSSGVQE